MLISEVGVVAGSAVERWQERLNVSGEHKDEEDDEAAPSGLADEDKDKERIVDEYAYLPETAAQKQGDTQALGAATEDQARQSEAVQPPQNTDDETENAGDPYQVDNPADPDHHPVQEGDVTQTEQTLRSDRQAGTQSIMDLDPATNISDKKREDEEDQTGVAEIDTNMVAEDSTIESHAKALQNLIAAKEESGDWPLQKFWLLHKHTHIVQSTCKLYPGQAFCANL